MFKLLFKLLLIGVFIFTPVTFIANSAFFADLVFNNNFFKEIKSDIFNGTDNFWDKLYVLDDILSIETLSTDPLILNQNIDLPDSKNLAVPFTSQAPFGDWSMPYQEACEEASIIMVKHYLFNEPLSRETADASILNLTHVDKSGLAPDINAFDTKNIAEEFYQLTGYVYYNEMVTLENIKILITAGYPVIIPAAGQELKNPNFTGAGPPYHMLVITGYDEKNFITNDPGTRKGQSYIYSYETILNAIHDWTENKKPIQEGEKAMLILVNKNV